MKKLLDVMKENQLHALLLTDGYNIHYNSGYRGHEGYLLITEENAYILTDSRYTEQAEHEAPDYEIVDIKAEGYAKTVCRLLGEKKSIRLGFENRHISYQAYRNLTKELPASVELVELNASVNELRMVKDEAEIEKLARAEAIGDEAFSYICTILKPGMTERQVALALEVRMRELGASGLSFDTIAASGTNGSLPHAVPTDKALAEGEFLTMDFGCVYEGYCSDMTRTVCIGKKPSEEQRKVYDTVYKAQTEALFGEGSCYVLQIRPFGGTEV